MPVQLHMRATVRADGRIEVAVPDLPVGTDVEVTVIPHTSSAAVPPPPPQPRRSALDIIESYEGPKAFHTADEVDAYIREERASWER